MSKQKPLWFRLPVEAGPPALVSESVGFTKLLSRPAGSHRIEVNVLDSFDARLLRAGIVVAHRRLGDGQREWYISGPDWPGIPDEASYSLDETGELPETLQSKLNIFLRDESLGPIATFICERREYLLRGDDTDLVAIRDDLITITRDGVELSHTREITMTPQTKLRSQQRDFILSAFEAVDATPLSGLPSLQQRIGPPATGLTSFRPPAGVHKDMTLEEFVSEVLLAHLYSLVLTELERDLAKQRQESDALRRDLRGLATVLEPQWRDQLETDLGALSDAQPEEREPVLLRVVDALVGAVRAPQLGNLSVDNARAALASRVEQSLLILFDRCRALEVAGTDDSWGAALRSATQLAATVQLLEPLFGKSARKLGKELDRVTQLLQSSVAPPEDIELVGMTPAEAFQLGRDVEHAQWSVALARRQLIDTWPAHVAAGRKALKKMRKKLA